MINTHFLSRIFYSLVSVPILSLYLNTAFLFSVIENRLFINTSVLIVASILLLISMGISFLFKFVYKIDWCISLRYFELTSNIGFYSLYIISVVSLSFFSTTRVPFFFVISFNFFYLFHLLLLYFICSNLLIPIKSCQFNRVVILERSSGYLHRYSFFHYDTDLSYNSTEEVVLEGQKFLLKDLIEFEKTFSKRFYNFSKEELSIVLMSRL